MATATLPARTEPSNRPFKPATEPVRGSVLASVRIRTDKGAVSEFGVSFPKPDPAVAVAAVRLVKDDGEIYDVALGTDGLVRCDCADGTFHPERPGGCKHIVALRALIRSFAACVPLAYAPTAAGPVPLAAG